MQSKAATFIQQLQEFVGPTFHGQVTLTLTEPSQTDLSIAIIAIGSCAKSWVMDRTTEASPKPLPSRPTSQSRLSSNSSPSISEPFQPISAGTLLWRALSKEADILSHLLAGSDGSSVDGPIRLHLERLLHLIPKAP